MGVILLNKRILTPIIIVIMMLTLFNIPALASNNSISPCNLYTSSCSSTITISGKTATGKSSATGYYGTTTKIEIYQELQRYTASGGWTYAGSGSKTINNYIGSYSKDYSNLSNGTYRIKSVFTVYSGSKSETITKYSSSKTIV